ncbi:MAG: biotin transporter BioY [Clostridia bacterium]|nr:biotin transporter BioY [Clostridia bacterium]
MKNSIKPLVMTALFAAITCVLSIISIPLPFSPVPFTLSLLAVFLSGSFLSPLWAFLSQTVYILIGIAGVPVFSGFRAGFAVIIGPTGGFLIAYPFMALITALFVKYFKKINGFFLPLAGMVAALFVCYAFGTAVYCVYAKVSVAAALPAVVLPFIPFDCVKAAIAAALRLAVAKRTEKANRTE